MLWNTPDIGRRQRMRVLGLGLPGCLAIGLALSPALVAAQSTVYKYRDESGRWVYSDRKPADDAPELEVKTFAADNRDRRRPHIRVVSEEGQDKILGINPYYAPVLFVFSPFGGRKDLGALLVQPTQQSVLFERPTDLRRPLEPDFAAFVGEPMRRPDTRVAYRPPIPEHGRFRITQGFAGQYSHQSEPNRNAVDISMPFGTPVHAARPGTVIDVKDDYHLGSADSTFFLDKANYLRVLHDDGSYAVYAHLLMGSVTVRPGAVVAVGQQIARSGNSGFSSGPHLHFAVQYNDKKKGIRSVPFLFANRGRATPPRAGQELSLQ